VGAIYSPVSTQAKEMKPDTFPGAGIDFTCPNGYSPSQIGTIKAMVTEVVGGNIDGDRLVTVAWRPDAADLERLNNGGLVFLHCVNGLLPHFLTTTLDGVIKSG